MNNANPSLPNLMLDYIYSKYTTHSVPLPLYLCLFLCLSRSLSLSVWQCVCARVRSPGLCLSRHFQSREQGSTLLNTLINMAWQLAAVGGGNYGQEAHEVSVEGILEAPFKGCSCYGPATAFKSS